MRALAGPRSFQYWRELSLSTCLNKCARILFPIEAIEINGQKETGLIQKHWINPQNEIPAPAISSGKMPSNDIVGY